MHLQIPSRIDKIELPLLKEKGIELYLKRDDLIHPIISGNKWRKLKFNIEKVVSSASTTHRQTILTFGGAYSNHLHATAFACKEFGLKCIGIVRGNERSPHEATELNQTLQECIGFGMQLHFVSREDYRQKSEKDFMEELKSRFGNFYLIPEGGANYEGILGCKEILKEEKVHFDFITCAAGTGTTLTGLLLSLSEGEKLMGFPALKGGEFLKGEMEKTILNYFPEEKSKMNWLELICDYHFGGYAKVNDELKNFVSDFFRQTNIQLDYIYNGKMMFGLFEMIQKNNFKRGARILAIHTGGTQGNRGF